MVDIEALTDLCKKKLKEEEGVRLVAYQDTKNLWTVGVGWCIQRSPMRLTEMELRLSNDVAQSIAECLRAVPNFINMSPNRQMVMVDMTHQMGIGEVLEFHDMMAALRVGAWAEAAEAMLDSNYAREDAPARAHRNAQLMISG